ncbi:MAG: lasso peptide biosynthesis B2 protein [Betaproteobacteria bacterium]|nr:lasso peptide biosynthesis B2 protein [Betaproteobacteria bacterium]
MIDQIRRFAALPANDQWLLLRAAGAVAFVRIMLWAFPFRWVCARVRSQEVALTPREGTSAARMAWAVTVASRRIPAASCLTQALTLQWMMARAGHSARLCIGVDKSPAQGFEAHAWVEAGGEILLGSHGDVNRFVPILSLPGDQS